MLKDILEKICAGFLYCLVTQFQMVVNSINHITGTVILYEFFNQIKVKSKARNVPYLIFSYLSNNNVEIINFSHTLEPGFDVDRWFISVFLRKSSQVFAFLKSAACATYRTRFRSRSKNERGSK